MPARQDILLVEDKPGDARLIKEMLVEASDPPFNLINVERLEAAQQCLSQQSIDIILLDLSLPDSFGLGTFNRIHDQALTTPIIVLSGLDDHELALAAVKGGAQDYLIKGEITPGILMRAIRYALERKSTEVALRQSEERYRSLVQNARDIIFTLCSNGILTSLNPAFEVLTGWPASRWKEKPLNELVHPEDILVLTETLEQAKAGIEPDVLTLRISKKGGSYMTGELIITPELKEDRPDKILGIIRDITERSRIEEQFRYLANHDTLSGLPNRFLLMNKLEQALASAQRNDTFIAIMFIDLDGFKEINDNLGHHVGDQIIKIVAERLCICARRVDIVARLGGDEFVFAAMDVENLDDIARHAYKILSTVTLPMNISTSELIITGSIGVSVFPRDGEDVQTLLQAADTAMYKAKQSGKNNVCFCSPPAEQIMAAR